MFDNCSNLVQTFIRSINIFVIKFNKMLVFQILLEAYIYITCLLMLFYRVSENAKVLYDFISLIVTCTSKLDKYLGLTYNLFCIRV